MSTSKKPLTWEKLQSTPTEGMPVYIEVTENHRGLWADAWYISPYDLESKGFCKSSYGKTWFAYLHKPKEVAP